MAEINAFYDWQEANPLAASSICLWHALMSIANKAGWPESFSTAISTLESRTRYGRDTIYSARNQLRQAGRIEFKERRGRQSTLYHIIPFVSEYPTQLPTQHPTQVPTQPPTQLPTNNILDYIIPDHALDGDGLKASELARACAEGGGNGGKPAGDDEALQQAEALAARLFPYYFGRPATGHDAGMLLGCICCGERRPDGSIIRRIDPDRVQVAEYAFRIASERGAHNWAFIKQVLSILARRGLRTLEECEDYDAQREFDKDNGR